jgi:hypothetical protein
MITLWRRMMRRSERRRSGMPSLGGIPLLDTAGTSVSGAAFELDTPTRESAVAAVEGWTIEVSQQTKLVVVRGGSDTSHEGAFEQGLLRAQQGLDLLSIQGKGDLSIRRFDDDHLVWWKESGGIVIRVVSIAPVTVDVPPVNVEVTDASGRPVPQAPTQPPEWHESFRYFRLSQTSDDLFDAYRNAYLALESLLSSITPQRLDAEGKVAEGEGAWFRRALEQAGTIVELPLLVPAETADPAQYLFDELFVSMRSAMSHAKSGRKVLLPRTQPERQDVTDSLSRLVRLYLKLVEEHLAVRRMGGGMSTVAFRMMFGGTLSDMTVVASDDESPFDSSDSAINPGGGRTVTLTEASPLDTSVPFVATKLASAPTNVLDDLPFIHRVGGVSPSGNPAMAAVLEAPLVLGSAVRFEVMLGLRGTNLRQPRTRYSF